MYHGPHRAWRVANHGGLHRPQNAKSAPALGGSWSGTAVNFHAVSSTVLLLLFSERWLVWGYCCRQQCPLYVCPCWADK
jgi:hypothetical protein